MNEYFHVIEWFDGVILLTNLLITYNNSNWL